VGGPRTRRPRTTLAAVAAATAIGGCLGVAVHVLLPSAGAGAPPAPVAYVDGAQLERGGEPTTTDGGGLDRSVVEVGASGCGERRQASATLVRGWDGDLVLTNAHVVAGAETVEVQSPDGASVTARVRGTLVGRDVALLALPPGSSGSFEALAVGSPATPGDRVSVAGFPAGERTRRDGRVEGVEVRSGYGGTSEVLLVDAEARPGVSGGAVLDAEGEVVGLVAARDPRSGDTVAYPIQELLTGSIGPRPGC